jgi:hypothetical protein
MDLPRIDEHRVEVEAGPDAVWAGLLAHLDRSFAGRMTERYARLVGCEDTTPAGPRPLAEGSVLVGFHVAVADPLKELALRGRHRFSDYALIFRIDELGPQRSRLRAESRGTFPGLLGGAYKLAVVGTRGHVVIVRRMLAAIAERSGSGSGSGSVREPGSARRRRGRCRRPPATRCRW